MTSHCIKINSSNKYQSLTFKYESQVGTALSVKFAVVFHFYIYIYIQQHEWMKAM